MNLLLSLFRRKPTPPTVEPVAPPREVLDAVSAEDQALLADLVEHAQHVELATVRRCSCSVCKLRRAAEPPESEGAPAMVPVRAVPSGVREQVPATSFGTTADAVVAGEDGVLDTLAEETARNGVSPWDAAVSVFGGAAVARDATGTGLCGSVAGEPAGSVPA